MTIISITISLGLPFFLLYSRKRKWYYPNIKRLIAIGMSCVGILGFLMSGTNDHRLFFYGLLTTPIFIIFDSLFKQLSFKTHNRDFYLWLRGSHEIDDSFSGIGTNKHVKLSDMIFSIALLILIVGLCVFGAVLFGKDALYDKLIN